MGKCPQSINFSFQPLMGIQDLELANNPLQCDCHEMILRWLQTLQHYEILKFRVFANSKIISCMDSSSARCHTYFTQHLWSLNVPPFLKLKHAEDLYKRCDIYTMVEPSEPRRFRSSSPLLMGTNELGED